MSDEVTKEICETQITLDRTEDKRPPKKETHLDRAIELHGKVQPYLENAGSIISAGSKAIAPAAEAFLRHAKVVVDALEELSKLHPIVATVVIVFKTAISMDVKRRENDKQIIELRTIMKEMMSELLRLKNTRDLQRSIKDALENRLTDICKDIREAANVCDAMKKSHRITRFLMSHPWKEELEEFALRFETHKAELVRVLTEGVHEMVRDIRHGLDELKAYISSRFDSLEDRNLSREVGRRRAKDYMESEGMLAKLVESIDQPEMQSLSESSRDTYVKQTVARIKNDLQMDVRELVHVNVSSFTPLFEMLLKQLRDDLELSIGRVVRSALREGPHMELQDPIIRELWEYMGWKGSTKARNFVLALRDFLIKKTSPVDIIPGTSARPIPKNESTIAWCGGRQDPKENNVDESPLDDISWALPYISMHCFRALVEAFDKDASGLITVQEANAFTEKRARPSEWSLFRWLAFWAIGFQQSLGYYAEKITRVLQYLHAMALAVMPANRLTVKEYVSSMELSYVDMLLASIKQGCTSTEYSDEVFTDKFSEYVEKEENNLRENLESIGFEIDGVNTLNIVTGSGRLEQHIFPTIYLLLRRSVSLLRLAGQGSKVLHPEELDIIRRSLRWTMYAVQERRNDLNACFRYRNLDIEQEMIKFTYGMYSLFQRTDNNGTAMNSFYCDSSNLGPFIDLQWLTDDDMAQPLPDEVILRRQPPPSCVYEVRAHRLFSAPITSIVPSKSMLEEQTAPRSPSYLWDVARRLLPKVKGIAQVQRYIELALFLEAYGGRDRPPIMEKRRTALEEELDNDQKSLCRDELFSWQVNRQAVIFEGRWSCDICSSSYGFDDMTATCLACTAPQGIPDSFDMCQACFAQTMTDESKETVFISAIHGQKHRSYHRVVFLRIMLHFRQRAGLIKQAKSAFKRCRVEYESGWTCCMICHKEVDLPCLSCIGCHETYMCLDCDKKRQPTKDWWSPVPLHMESHHWMHPLIYLCKESLSDVPSEPERKQTAAALEAQREVRLTKLEQHLANVDGKMNNLEAMLKTVIDQLSKLAENEGERKISAEDLGEHAELAKDEGNPKEESTETAK